MLTVKQRTSSGCENIIETRSVSYQPSSVIDGVRARTVYIRSEDGAMVPNRDGVFYVMNEAGNTIAKYDLGS
ncbi:hypothetical protein [Bradyrhizobium sp. HKCCYLS20291]|uniref:hypothetical protein n=1 Tax=Bradyrhizobium sp. HKCCYLS20291 TaxID=3420766 RepID=UPI003EBBF0C0